MTNHLSFASVEIDKNCSLTLPQTVESLCHMWSLDQSHIGRSEIQQGTGASFKF